MLWSEALWRALLVEALMPMRYGGEFTRSSKPFGRVLVPNKVRRPGGDEEWVVAFSKSWCSGGAATLLQSSRLV